MLTGSHKTPMGRAFLAETSLGRVDRQKERNSVLSTIEKTKVSASNISSQFFAGQRYNLLVEVTVPVYMPKVSLLPIQYGIEETAVTSYSTYKIALYGVYMSVYTML